jgi:uncharacterized membrane protein YphA (DoxX/SURF4 family)
VRSKICEISVVACLFLVLLRVAIGWQFLYEGIWKLNTQSTARPWSAEGYLANARGPFRDFFRSQLDDPNGLAKLDYEHMVREWDSWHGKFLLQYPDLDEPQKIRLWNLVNGPEYFAEGLAKLPAGVDLKSFKPSRKYRPPEGWFLRYNDKSRRLETNLHLVPEEQDSLLGMVEPKGAAAAEETKPELSAEAKAFQSAVNRLYDRSGKLSLNERLQVLLVEDPDRVGLVQQKHEGTIDYERPGKKQIYEHLLARYEANLARAKQAFQQEHLDKQWREILEKRAELVGPVDALTAEFHTEAYGLLTPAQMSRGPVPPAQTKVWQINQITMWSLTILGAMLMLGLFSRLSSLGAAALLLLFYLPMPPWPGVPEAPGPEHSLYINKNAIEFIACLALMFLPTGRWIGLDALVRRFILRKKTD